MQIFALVIDGLVRDVIEIAPGTPPLADRFHLDIVAQMRPAAPAVAPGWRWDGTAFLAPEAVQAAPPVPATVALWQFRREMQARGWWDQVQAEINALKGEARADAIEWLEYGTEVHRASPLLQSLAEALGVAEQLDDAFRAAAARVL